MKIVTPTEITLDFKDLEVILREKCYIDEDLTLKNIIRIPASHTLRIEFEKITDSQEKIPAPVIQDRGIFLKTPLKDLGLSRRIYNGLNHERIKTIQELLEYSIWDIMKFRNIGEKSIKELKEFLKVHNIFIKE